MAASEASSQSGATPGIRWSRVLAALAALLLVLEALSQALIYAYAGKPFESLSPYRWSAYGLVRNNPALTSPGFEIDRSGFRSLNEYQKQKPAGTLRVLLLGGSVLYSGLAGVRLDRYGRVSSAQTIAPYLESLLAADPLFAGHKIEVINAAVNFNRIVEVSSAYLEEYLHWQPDLVIVFGSINNFYWFRRAGDFAAGQTSLQERHPFRLEFERLVNDQSLAAFIERAWRTGAEHSAMLALASKGCVALADRLLQLSEALVHRGAGPPTAAPRPETAEEARAYMQLYASYADAMIAAARRAKQDIAFVWEPGLIHSEGSKPLSDEERSLLKSLDQTPEKAAQFEASRQAFHALFDGAGIPVVDPTEALKTTPETVFIDYVHYTPDGNRFIASIVYKQLRELLAARIKDKK
jgi:lysophospholipase L1-like esterase